MPIDYKCRETYGKVMLKIETCGKILSLFNEVVRVETRFFSRGVETLQPGAGWEEWRPLR